MSLVRHTAWSGIASVTSTLGRVAITGILARRLGPQLFGGFVFMQWLIEMSFLVFSFGLTGIAGRFFQQTVAGDALAFRGFDRWFWRAIATSTLLTAVVAAAATAVFSKPVSLGLGSAVALWAVSYALWMLVSARAQGLFEFGLMALCTALLIAVTLAGLFVLRTQDNVLVAVLITAAGQFAAAAVCAGGSAHRRSRPSAGALPDSAQRQVREYGGNVWVTSILSTLVWSRGEIPFIKGFLSDVSVGLYSSGITLTGIVNQAVSLLGGAMGPTLARMWDHGDRDELARFSAAATQLLLVAAGLAVGFLICFPHQIVGIVFGARFQESAGFVWILAFGTLGLASGCAGMIVQVATNARFTRNTNFIAGVALFGLLSYFVPTWGVQGAAIVRSIIQLSVGAVTFIWLGRLLGPLARTRRTLLSLAAIVILAGVLAGFRREWPEVSLVLVTGVFASYAAAVTLICAGGSPARMLASARYLATLRAG